MGVPALPERGRRACSPRDGPETLTTALDRRRRAILHAAPQPERVAAVHEHHAGPRPHAAGRRHKSPTARLTEVPHRGRLQRGPPAATARSRSACRPDALCRWTPACAGSRGGATAVGTTEAARVDAARLELHRRAAAPTRRARTPSRNDESRKQSRGCACSAAALAAINASSSFQRRSGPSHAMAAPQAPQSGMKRRRRSVRGALVRSGCRRKAANCTCTASWKLAQ